MAGAMLRTIALVLRFLQFCFAITCMGIFSYFMAVLANFGLRVLPRWQATESIVVIATVYTILAILLVLCLAGSKIFGIIAIVLDIIFVGLFCAVAWWTRHGAYQCNGLVQTPVGDGLSQYGAFGIRNTSNYRPRLGTACRLNRAVFALSILLIFLFLATAILQVFMSKKSKKDKRYDNNNYSKAHTKTTPWKKDHSSRSRSNSNRRSHREKDMEVAGATAGSRGLAGRRSGDSGSSLSDNAHNRELRHRDTSRDRPGHTPIVGRGNNISSIRDGTYPADGTYPTRNDGSTPLHSVTISSPTTTTTTTTHLGPNPGMNRTSSRGRRGQPEYAQGDSNGNTHVPGFNVPLTQSTPYHEITTKEQAALRAQNAGHNQPGYDQNITPGQGGYPRDNIGGQRDYDNTRGQNILPGQTGYGTNTVGNQRDYDNTSRGQTGYDQNILPGQAGYGRNTVGDQRDYDNTNRGQGEYGRDTTLGRERDITPGRLRDRTPGRDNTTGRTSFGRDRDITPSQTGYNRNTVGNQRDYDNTTRGQNDYDNTTRGQTGYNQNTNQGYDDYNQNPGNVRTSSAGRVRRF